MNIPRLAFWSMLALLVGLWLSSVAVAFRHGSWSAQMGSGHVTSRVRDLPEFNRIESQGDVDVTVTVGEPQRVTVSADDNVVPHIETTVRDGVLVVSTSGDWFTVKPASVRVEVPNLDEVTVDGSADVALAGLHGASFVATVHGSGDVEASGTVDRLEYSGFGSGDAKLRDLRVKNAVIRIAGSGDVHVNASDTIDARIDGSGDVHYLHSPTITQSVHGSGDVTHED